MKTILAAAIVVLSATAAQAYENTITDITYISWCSQNNVIVKDKNSQNVVLANCSEANLTCKEAIRYAGKQQVGTASCVQK